MTDAELSAQLLNTVLPLLVAVVLRPTWSKRRRATVALLVTVVVVVLMRLAIMAVADTPTDWQAWLRWILVSVSVSMVAYHGFWHSTGVTQRVEVATTRVQTAADATARSEKIGEAEAKEMAPF